MSLAPSQPPLDGQNPYQAPQVLAPSLAIAPAGNLRLMKVLRDFRSQIIALGVLWIFVGGMALGTGAFFVGYLSGDIPEATEPILLGVLGTAGLTWIVLGVLVCCKQAWALYVALALSYLSLLGNLVRFQWIVVVLLVLVILQAHRVLGWARELTRAGIPLTTRPENLQVRVAQPT